MKIYIIKHAKELVEIEDWTAVETLIIDRQYAEKNLVIDGFANLKTVFICGTKIESITITQCENLNVLKIEDNLELVDVDVESAAFTLCVIDSLPKLKVLNISDISSTYYTSHYPYILEISKTGLETINLTRCLNLSSLILNDNEKLLHLVVSDVGHLECLYTNGNSRFNNKISRIGVKNRS